MEVALVKLRVRLSTVPFILHSTNAPHSKAIGSGGLAVAVITDVSISAALTFYLQKSRTGFRKYVVSLEFAVRCDAYELNRSDSVITKLILLTITTGTLTTLVQSS